MVINQDAIRCLSCPIGKALAEKSEANEHAAELRDVLQQIIQSPGKSAEPRGGILRETLFVDYKLVLVAHALLKRLADG